VPDIFFDIIDEGMTVDVITENPVIDVGVSDTVVSVITVEGPTGPQGPPGTGSPVVGEQLSGLRDGVNTVFTTASAFRTGTLAVYLNGLREFNFAVTGVNQITFTDPPFSGDSLRADYVV
jgi:hypothetical protein